MNHLRTMLWEYQNHGLMPWPKALQMYYKNRKVGYCYLPESQCVEHKTSDTLFIVGSGPSISLISDHQWRLIGNHDCMGLNHAFLIEKKMNFYYCGYEPAANDTLKKIFSDKIRSQLTDTVWFLPRKVTYRFYHPRIVPEIFPLNPQICLS